MNSFEWAFPTRVVFGLGKFKSVGKHVRGLGKRAFIVTSRSFLSGGSRAAVLDELLAQLKRIDVEVQVFGETEPNPRTTTVDRAAALARQFRPRYVIALGGGSVMDAAKCIALLVENEGTIYEYCYRGPGKPMTPFNHTLPLVCIPTVAATSSETSLYAVVTHWEDHKKVTAFGEALIPRMAIIDPELTFTIPPKQTVDGAFDMITHVIESYLSTPTPAMLQDHLTEALVETVVKALPRVLANPQDGEARSNLSWAGALALTGVFSGRDGGWPIHAFEHGLSAWTDVAHGRGLAMLLPRFMKYDESVIGEKIARFNKKIFDTPSLDDGLIAYMKEVGAWTTLADIGVAPKDVQSISEKTVDHALEIKGIWKRGEEPYLDNCKPIYRKDAVEIMLACAE